MQLHHGHVPCPPHCPSHGVSGFCVHFALCFNLITLEFRSYATRTWQTLGGCKKKQWPSDLVVLNVDRCTLKFNIYNSQIKWNVSEILSWNPRQRITRVVFLISFTKICIYRLGESACPSRGFPRFLFFCGCFFFGWWHTKNNNTICINVNSTKRKRHKMRQLLQQQGKTTSE